MVIFYPLEVAGGRRACVRACGHVGAPAHRLVGTGRHVSRHAIVSTKVRVNVQVSSVKS